MELDELPSERQAEAGALDLLVRHPDLPELLEDHLLILGSDANPGVGDRHLDYSLVHGRPDVDPAALERELQRVGEQVQQHLLDLSLVGADRAERLMEPSAEDDATAARALTNESECAVDRGSEIEVGYLQLHPPRLDLGEIQDVVDERKLVLRSDGDLLQVGH